MTNALLTSSSPVATVLTESMLCESGASMMQASLLDGPGFPGAAVADRLTDHERPRWPRRVRARGRAAPPLLPPPPPPPPPPTTTSPQGWGAVGWLLGRGLDIRKSLKMDNDSDTDILNDLLSNDDVEDKKETLESRSLKELNFNFLSSESNKNETIDKEIVNDIYDDKIDSSDDEDRRNFEEQKYSNYGREIKNLLKNETENKAEQIQKPRESTSKSFNFSTVKSNNNAIKSDTNLNNANIKLIKKDVYSDPFFGLRIINPLISSSEFQQRMNGKKAITVSKIKNHITSDDLHNDWVIAGVLTHKSTTKTSKKGSSYAIWKLSDLSENINTISLFMFSTAYKTFWKTTTGTVLGILNPNILESNDDHDLATLSVDNPQKVMILGKSKDMGKCKSIKKNGEPCSSIVNLSQCEFCIYHVKQEYKKCSRRSELQSNHGGQGFSTDILKPKAQQQKTFPNGMQSFTPVYAKRNAKLHAKDSERLALLSGSQTGKEKPKVNLSTIESKNKGISVELTKNQMKKDFERLNKLRGWKNSTEVILQLPTNPIALPSLSIPPNICSPQIDDVQSKKSSNISTTLTSIPRLGTGCTGGTIDISLPVTKKHINIAKANAIKWVQKNGTIKQINPNKTRLNKEDKIERGLKRQREFEDSEEHNAKKLPPMADKFKELMQVQSAHGDLIEKSYEEEKEKYFSKLEVKERMEEKMMMTFKLNCKAVKCLVCKYTSFSASDLCKEQKHPLRVMDAVKRFFKCGDCGNRTVSLNRIPSHSCKKCNSSSWIRAAMMDEKKTKIPSATLSIRGGEEKFLGSAINDANLNLLVPESD
ncbi:hypothetical protein KM043_017293 [Ampulex compressa]|nr:hypothetical protein KM043_017293 [Ampulex compressa]